jgi:hypothetical protein
MMNAYTDEFSFMRHQTMRDQRPSKKWSHYMATWLIFKTVKKFFYLQ